MSANQQAEVNLLDKLKTYPHKKTLTSGFFYGVCFDSLKTHAPVK